MTAQNRTIWYYTIYMKINFTAKARSGKTKPENLNLQKTKNRAKFKMFIQH